MRLGVIQEVLGSIPHGGKGAEGASTGLDLPRAPLERCDAERRRSAFLAAPWQPAPFPPGPRRFTLWHSAPDLGASRTPERRGDRLEPVPSTPQTQRHHSDDIHSTETRQLLHAVHSAKASASSLESSLGSAATWSRTQNEVLLFAARARRTARSRRRRPKKRHLDWAGFAKARPGRDKGGGKLGGSACLLALLVNGRDGYGVSAYEPGYQASRELVAAACSSRARAPGPHRARSPSKVAAPVNEDA